MEPQPFDPHRELNDEFSSTDTVESGQSKSNRPLGKDKDRDKERCKQM